MAAAERERERERVEVGEVMEVDGRLVIPNGGDIAQHKAG